MRRVLMIALSLLSTACSQTIVIPRVSVYNGCPQTVAIVRDGAGNEKFRLATGERQSFKLDHSPRNQLVTADLYDSQSHATLGSFSQTFGVDVPDYRYNYPTGPSSTPDAYDWQIQAGTTFSGQRQCTATVNGASIGGWGGGAGRPAWGNPGPAWSRSGRPAWGNPGPAW